MWKHPRRQGEDFLSLSFLKRKCLDCKRMIENQQAETYLIFCLICLQPTVKANMSRLSGTFIASQSGRISSIIKALATFCKYNVLLFWYLWAQWQWCVSLTKFTPLIMWDLRQKILIYCNTGGKMIYQNHVSMWLQYIENLGRKVNKTQMSGLCQSFYWFLQVDLWCKTFWEPS